MDAFNCAKPLQSKNGLPPLPRSSRRSLKSTVTCGIASTSPTQVDSKRLASTPKMHDPFAYDSVALTRDLFRGFILQSKDSLTKQEHSFLEDLVEDGDEKDFNSAMTVLSDKQLFFHQKNWTFEESASRLLGCAMSPLSRNDSDSHLNDIDSIAIKNSLLDARVNDSPSSNASSKENYQLREEHFEIVHTGHGAIILQDLEIPAYSEKSRAKSDETQSESHQFQENIPATPVQNNKRAISEPRTAPAAVPARIGTPHRQRRVLERKQSLVHSSMWKAYNQGLSLTPNSSFQSSKDYSKSILLNGQRSKTSSPYRYIGTHNRKGSKAKSRGSTPSDMLRGSEISHSRALSKQMSALNEPISSLHPQQKISSSLQWAAESEADALSVNADRQGGIFGRTSSSPLGSDDMLANSSLNTHNLLNSSNEQPTGSFIPAFDLADSVYSYGSDTLPIPLYSGCDSPSRRVSQSSFASFPSLQRGHESSQSIPSLYHGQSLNESINSISSIHHSQSVRQVSRLSTTSSTSQYHLLESSQWSAASSVTLNSLENAHDLEKERSIVSNGQASSPRHEPPMRPTRSPSPKKSKPRLVKRAVSDGALPPRQSYTIEDKARHKMPNLTQLNCRRKSIIGRVDILETIASQDERPRHLQDDDSSADRSVLSTATERGQPPVLIRNASEGSDLGLGLEMADIDNSRTVEKMLRLERVEKKQETKVADSVRPSSRSAADERLLNKLVGTELGTLDSYELAEIRQCTSEDHFLQKENNAHQTGSLLDGSEDDMSAETNHLYDSWNMLTEDRDENEFCFAFQILGTNADDVTSTPHVLSPPLMESLYHFLPYSVSESNYFMKYSLIRDGASFVSLLQHIRGSRHTLLALETTEGEVFGSFTSSTWRNNGESYFGSGESFLWRMKNDRKTVCKSVLDQAQLESDVEVFAWTGSNYMTQLCTNDKIALGGGGGFGLVIESNMLHGQTNQCATFGNPPLSKEHHNGGSFEIVNLEIWTMTPCNNVKEAEKLEMAKLFLEANRLGV